MLPTRRKRCRTALLAQLPSREVRGDDASSPSVVAVSSPESASAAALAIREFFQRDVTVGLHLPDGWFGGRPMENQHELTFVLDRPDRLLVELDERLLLVFTGEGIRVERATTTLLLSTGTPAVSISGFAQLIVDLRLYGSTDVRATVYPGGEVTFVSAL